MDKSFNWKVFNPNGVHRILVTKMLPGKEWLDILMEANCRVEVNMDSAIVPKTEIMAKIGDNCKAVIGQLTEEWDAELFKALKNAGGIGYSNYAVGFNNVNVEAATKNRIPVGNTPGVLTETTAEMAVTLTMACARRIVEADRFMRQGHFKGWLPDLFLGKRLLGCTVGIIGAGRIGSAYAMMMVRAFQMNLIYYSNNRNKTLEEQIEYFNEYQKKLNNKTVAVQRAKDIKGVLGHSDVVSIHTPLNNSTHHLITKDELSLMKSDAILVNTSRGPIIDEMALAEHCAKNVSFSAGLDVFEEEPIMVPGLKGCDNVILAPHIASATTWTREGMSKLAALNIKGLLKNYDLWPFDDMSPFLEETPIPEAIPSIINPMFFKTT